MGTAGLVGPIMTYQSMMADGVDEPLIIIIKIIAIQFVLPGMIAWGVNKWLRRKDLVRNGDMRIAG